MKSEPEIRSPLPSADRQANLQQAPEASLSPPSSDPFLDILSEPEIKRRSGVKWLLGSSLLLTVGFTGWWGYKAFVTPSVEPLIIPTEAVEVGSVEVTITASGTVELKDQQTFKAPGDVTVESVQVEERQRIEAGTILLELRDRALQQKLIDQEISNQQADNTRVRQQERFKQQQEELEVAQKRFEDSKSLLERGFISEEEYRGDRQKVDTAISALKDTQVEIANSELTLQNNQRALQSIYTQIADNQIVSPIDAIVLKVEVKSGDGVSQGGRLLTIGDPSQETVRLQLGVLDASKVEVNMPVRVSMIGPNPQIFPGRISSVSPQVVAAGGGSTSGGDGGQQQGTVEVEVTLDNPTDGFLLPGSIASVEIVVEQRQSVTKVPLMAVHTEEDTTFVWVKDEENKAQKRTVTVGLEDLISAEITSGLEAGDEIVSILPPGMELTPGTPLADAEAMPPDLSDSPMPSQ